MALPSVSNLLKPWFLIIGNSHALNYAFFLLLIDGPTFPCPSLLDQELSSNFILFNL